MIQYIVQYSKIKHSIVKYYLQSIIVRINYNEDLVTYVRSIVQDTAMQCIWSVVSYTIDPTQVTSVVQYKVQYSAIRYNTVYLITLLYRKNTPQYITIHLTVHSTIFNIQTVQCSTQQHSIIRYNKLQCSSVCHRTVLQITMKYYAIHSTIQYNTTQ